MKLFNLSCIYVDKSIERIYLFAKYIFSKEGQKFIFKNNGAVLGNKLE